MTEKKKLEASKESNPKIIKKKIRGRPKDYEKEIRKMHKDVLSMFKEMKKIETGMFSLVRSFEKNSSEWDKRLTRITEVNISMEEIVSNVLLAIRQNEYLQAWYPAQQGHPEMKVVGRHPCQARTQI